MTNAIKVLLQMQNGFLQLESTLYSAFFFNAGHRDLHAKKFRVC
jgi:hypothetical protein